MSTQVLMVLADGFEDIEAIAPIDVLTRCGITVTVAATHNGPVDAAYGTTIQPRTQIAQVSDKLFDGLIMPGGTKNARVLAADPDVIALVHHHHEKKRLVGAICASPSHVLAEAAGILKGINATGDPGFNNRLAAAGAIVHEVPVMVDGHIVTGMGPGAALSWGLMLCEYLTDRATADKWAAKWRITRDRPAID